MNVIKAAAIVPRRLRGIRGNSLTARMALLASLVAFASWMLLDLFYHHSVEQAVSDEWRAQLQRAARAERAWLHETFISFVDTGRYLAAYAPLERQLERWNRRDGGASSPPVSLWKPDWLSRVSSFDGHLPIDYALVLGAEREVHAVYKNGRLKFPGPLLQPDSVLLRSAMERSWIFVSEGGPILMTAYPVNDRRGRVQGSLLIASRINRAFLIQRLGQPAKHSVSGLLLGSARAPVALGTGMMAQALSGDPGASGNFELITSELLLDSDSGTELRHALWADKRNVHRAGEQFMFSVRQQRTLALLVFCALFSMAFIWISRRIEKIHHIVDHYSQLLGIQLPKPIRGDQIQRLSKRLQRLSEEVLAETYALEYQAQHDSLTNLPNRSLLLEHLEIELQSAQDERESLALFVMDLDQFKEVNDTLGHPVGDRLLQEVGRRLVTVLRRTDTVARLGGDEFAILLPGADYQRSKAVCRKIMAALERPIKIDNVRLRAGISIGVALCPDHGEDANLLLQHADVAMYEAKRKHRGFSFYTADGDDHSISRLGLSGELKDAIERDQLVLEYQPMVDIKSGRIFCAEALVRWFHPEFGCIPPEEFVPGAEQTGVIRPLTLWVIDKALEQTVSWRRAGIELSTSVNLSVRSLQDRKLPGQVEKLLDKHQVNPQNVILEITESAIMSDPLTARRVMRRLSNMGFQLSIDDFGTGYSSLAYLKQLPVDEIKIDKSFVTRMDQDENDAVIVRATIDLAHNLGLKVVAEGVESTDVWTLLEMLGCDTAQGYFIRKPLQPHELARWIRSKECQQASWSTPLRMAE